MTDIRKTQIIALISDWCPHCKRMTRHVEMTPFEDGTPATRCMVCSLCHPPTPPEERKP